MSTKSRTSLSRFQISIFLSIAVSLLKTNANAAVADSADGQKSRPPIADSRTANTSSQSHSQQAVVPPIPAADTATKTGASDYRTQKVPSSNLIAADARANLVEMQNSTKIEKDQLSKDAVKENSSENQVTTSIKNTNPNANTNPNTNANTNSNTNAKIPEATVDASLQQQSVIPATSTTNATDTTPTVPGAPSLETQGNLVPNGAALQTQMLPLVQNESSPWKTLLTGGSLILAMAGAGVIAVRLKNGRPLVSGRNEKQLQLLTSMALSPKRQILLVKIRDKEVALASTEHGITLLTELPHVAKNNLALLDNGGGEENKRRSNKQLITEHEPEQLVAAHPRNDEKVGQETAIARSEMLMSALKNLRDKNVRKTPPPGSAQNSISTSQSSEESVSRGRQISDVFESERSKQESTLKQTRATFPKYLANAFENESKRNLNQNLSQASDDASNVTNLIKERLKELKPLS